ncbi:MAG: HetZ-related protein [Cyanobacteria bacterium SID2]|nr:HetZ-related protein [Cyanobacteria bacterium SID2]MBP0004971.1 HetZ-related protein [Cyanobacteria bacterium SBC]
MNIKLATSFNQSIDNNSQGGVERLVSSPVPTNAAPSIAEMPLEPFAETVLQHLQGELETSSRSGKSVARRIAAEVERICSKSDRIQRSGDIEKWKLTLVRHRLQKIAAYYKLGSKRGRVELHSNLSVMVYRHIAPTQAKLGFQGRYNLIEDFLQGFYIEVLRAFRREHDVPEDYTPRSRVELAEYMAFTEQYAKRRISLPGRNAQQLVILRAQGFAKGQPPETSIDMELAVESGKTEEDESHSRSAAVRQVREQMVAETIDPSEAVMRDRVIKSLIGYLKEQGQSDCIDYLVLKLQDLSAHEIDEILGLSARQRDYLQQRFKYHVDKFSRAGNWKLVHQWLGADLDRNLGMSPAQWKEFLEKLTPQQRKLIALKQAGFSESEISTELKCTPKQAQKRWSKLLDLAWQERNA